MAKKVIRLTEESLKTIIKEAIEENFFSNLVDKFRGKKEETPAPVEQPKEVIADPMLRYGTFAAWLEQQGIHVSPYGVRNMQNGDYAVAMYVSGPQEKLSDFSNIIAYLQKFAREENAFEYYGKGSWPVLYVNVDAWEEQPMIKGRYYGKNSKSNRYYTNK